MKVKALIILVIIICLAGGVFIGWRFGAGPSAPLGAGGAGEEAGQAIGEEAGDEAGIEQDLPEEIRITNTPSVEGFVVMHQWDDDTMAVIFKAKPGDKSDLYSVSSYDNGKTWAVGSPKRITDSHANAEHTSIAQLGEATFLAWDNGSEVHYLVSEDKGKTWKDRQLFKNAWYPYIYNTGNQLLLVFISQEKGLGGVIKYSVSDNGFDWSEPKEIVKNSDLSGKTSIWGNTLLYQTTQGELWLIWDSGSWTEAMPEGASQTSDLYWMYSQNNGVDWSAPKKITQNTEKLDDIEPRICENNKGTPILFYEARQEEDITQDYKLYYREYAEGEWSLGVKLPKPYNYPEEHILDWRPYCLKDNNGQLWLAWVSDRGRESKNKTRAIEFSGAPRDVYVAPFNLDE